MCDGPMTWDELAHEHTLQKKEIVRLRGVIAAWYAYWPEPWGEGRDGFEMQEFGEKHGILIAEEKTTPCGEGCNCTEFFGDNETVTCYRLKPEFVEGA